MFDGIAESRDENDTECQRKIKEALHHIPELVVSDVKMARCHQLGVCKGRTRLVIVNFHWYEDVETIWGGLNSSQMVHMWMKICLIYGMEEGECWDL